MSMFEWIKRLNPTSAPSSTPTTPPTMPAIGAPKSTSPAPAPPTPSSARQQTSEQGVALIKEFEGCKLTSYPDVVGVWTIGFGTTRIKGKPVTKGMTCTQQEAENYLREDLHQFEQTVNSVLSQPIPPYQFDACVCLTYNIGSSGFLGSTICRKLKSGNTSLVTEQNFVAWNKVRDSRGILVESKGLTRRRKAEYHLFSTGAVKTQF